eukprot:5365585-Prymnesium_polylepis.1
MYTGALCADDLDPPVTLTIGCVGGNLGGGEGGGLMGGEGGAGGFGDGGGEGDEMFSELAWSTHEWTPKLPLCSVILCTFCTSKRCGSKPRMLCAIPRTLTPTHPSTRTPERPPTSRATGELTRMLQDRSKSRRSSHRQMHRPSRGSNSSFA